MKPTGSPSPFSSSSTAALLLRPGLFCFLALEAASGVPVSLPPPVDWRPRFFEGLEPGGTGIGFPPIFAQYASNISRAPLRKRNNEPHDDDSPVRSLTLDFLQFPRCDQPSFHSPSISHGNASGPNSAFESAHKKNGLGYPHLRNQKGGLG